MSTDPRWVRVESVLGRFTLDGALVLGEDSPEPMLLTGGAAAVWAALHEPRSATQLIDDLAQSFDVERDRLAADVVPLLDEFSERGLIEQVP